MNHEPDPSFVEHLEWQMRTALRRRERFAGPVTIRNLGWLRTSALVLVSLLGGAGAVVAAERIQDSRQKEYLLARGRIEMEMIELQLQHAADTLEYMQRLHKNGVIHSRDVLEAQALLQHHRIDLLVKKLDLQEIELTGSEPSRELTAPLVAGRDFVAQRLKYELERAEHEFADARERFERTVQMHQAAIVTQREVSEAEEAVSGLEDVLEWVRRRMQIREEFLDGELPAEQVWLLVLQAEREKQLRMSEKRLRLLLERHELNVVLEQTGRAANVARQTDLEIRLLEAEIKLIRLELRRIEELMKD